MQRPLLVVEIGTGGRTSPVVVQEFVIVVDVVRVISFAPVIIPLAVTVVGAIAPGEATYAVVATFVELSPAVCVIAVVPLCSPPAAAVRLPSAPKNATPAVPVP